MGWPLSGFETCPGICLAVLGDSNINKRSLEFALWFSSHIATQKFHPFVLIKFQRLFFKRQFLKIVFWRPRTQVCRHRHESYKMNVTETIFHDNFSTRFTFHFTFWIFNLFLFQFGFHQMNIDDKLNCHWCFCSKQ